MDKINQANQPYFIQNKSKTINIPINCIDSIYIHIIKNEPYENPEEDIKFWSPYHQATFDINMMTVIFDNKHEEVYDLTVI